MKNSKNDRHILINCIVSGIVFIIIGMLLIFLIVTGTMKGESSSLLCVVLISLVSIAAGIYQILKPWREKRYSQEEKIFGTPQNQKYQSRKDKAILKQKNKTKKHKNIYKEIYWHRITTVVIIIPISVVLSVLFYFWSYAWIGYIVSGFCLLYFLYELCGIPLRKFKKTVINLGIDYDELNIDFMQGAMYTFTYNIINIGRKYTVFVWQGNNIILRNDDIVWVYPAQNETEMYQNGVYTGKITNHSIKIVTCYRAVYTMPCAEFADEMIMDEYIRNNCSVLIGFSQELAEIGINNFDMLISMAKKSNQTSYPNYYSD